MRIYLVLVSALNLASCRPQGAVVGHGPIDEIAHIQRNRDETDIRTTRPPVPAIRESMKMLTNQLMETDPANFTMDTRTPPKIRLQHRNQANKLIKEENSHPGIAVPMDMDSFTYETTTKKQEGAPTTPVVKTTTDGGFSTWILLSGQFTTTAKPRKPSIKPSSAEVSVTAPSITTSTTEKVIKTTLRAKPTTKLTPKPTTKPTVKTTLKPVTKAPTVTTRKPAITIATTTESKLMTKIKASLLNNAVNNKTKTTPLPQTRNTVSQVKNTVPQTRITVSQTRTTVPQTRTTVVQTTPTTVLTTRKQMKATTARTTIKTTTTPIAEDEEEEDSGELEPEAKDGTVDLDEKTSTTTKKPVRATGKPGNKKKNKIRRRKPENATSGNSTKIATKQKPIGTQIYNYFSREVMPTVGVGLFGLMVTAGLASYFLYPFGSLRRAYEDAVDRKDVYSYNDYSGGVPEEEAFGKVIEGMENNDYSMYGNELGYKHSSYYPVNDYQNNNNNWGGYGSDVLEKESGYTVADRKLEQKFVVGNIPKDFMQSATPAAVPEHGPRRLRIRRRRDVPIPKDKNIKENEISYEKPTTNYYFPPHIRPLQRNITESHPETSTKQNVTENFTQQEYPNFFSFFRNLIEMKVRMGLEFLLKTTDTVNRYLRGVQSRVEEVLREKQQKEQLRKRPQ